MADKALQDGWFYAYGKPAMSFNRLMDLNTYGLSFHRQNLERSKRTFLPVYYPNIMLRRKRVQLFPSKIYSHRILPTNKIDMRPKKPTKVMAIISFITSSDGTEHKIPSCRHNFRYFTLSYLPTNAFNRIKWHNQAFPYPNLKNAIKATPKTNFHKESPEKVRIDFFNRGPYFTKPLTSTSNYCADMYKHDQISQHTISICEGKLPVISTPFYKNSINNLKTTSSTIRFSTKAYKPSLHHLTESNSFLDTIKTSKILFTIKDAITPHTLINSGIKNEKTTESYFSSNIIKPKSSNIFSEFLTMTSNPINIEQTKTYTHKQPTETTTYISQDNGTNNFNMGFNSENLSTIKSYLDPEQFNDNTCSNFSSDITKNCVFKIEDNNRKFISTTPIQESITPSAFKKLPMVISTVDEIISTTLSTLSYFQNTPTPAYWNSTEKSNIVTNNITFPISKRIKRPAHRRNKIINLNRRLVFKEKIKDSERTNKLLTLATYLPSTESNSKDTPKYIPSTSAQTIPWAQSTKAEPLTTISTTSKNTKSKFQMKNRHRWTPKYYGNTYRKANNVTTSTKMTMVIRSSTESQPNISQQNKTNKLRSKIKTNRRGNFLRINTTQSITNIQYTTAATTSKTTSTLESAIMRISNMSSGKLSIAKNVSSNSFIDMAKPRNGFVAELPIVTYFKEVTESRRI